MTGTQDTQYDVSSPKIVLVGFLGTVILFAIVVLLVVVFYQTKTEQDYVKNESQPQVEFSQLVTRQLGTLAEYRVLDKQKGVYAIPISKAMDLIVARRQQNPEGPPGVDDAAAAPAPGEKTPAEKPAEKAPAQKPVEKASAKKPADAAAGASDKPAEPQPEGGQP